MVLDKFKRLGIPYLFFIIITYILKLCVPGGVNRQVDLSLKDIIFSYLFPFDGPLQEMWFVAVIFIYFLFRELYIAILKNKNLTLFVFLISLVLYYIPENKVRGFFCIK